MVNEVISNHEPQKKAITLQRLTFLILFWEKANGLDASFDTNSYLKQKRNQTQAVFGFFWWELVDSNHRSITQQIYSLSPLATRESSHLFCFRLHLSSSACLLYQRNKRNASVFSKKVLRYIVICKISLKKVTFFLCFGLFFSSIPDFPFSERPPHAIMSHQ